MKTRTLTAFVLLILVFSSCSNQRKEGDWDDNILLSRKTATFSANGDSITITTGGIGWWLSNISINDKFISIENELQNQTNNYFKIQTDSCLIERKDKKTLFIRLNKNKYNRERKLQISLQAGDYFDGITVTQKAP
jgi:hypothetical protein